MRLCRFITVIAVAPHLVSGQTADTKPRFEAAAVYDSAPSRYPAMKTGIRADRFEMKTATMVDIVAAAYGVEADKVMGGPNWLDTVRFDIIARLPANASRQTISLMLQSLLADRFALEARTDQRMMPAFVLSVGNGKPKMRQAGVSATPGCQRQPQATEGPSVPVVCRGLTMQAFAQQLRGMAGDYLMSPVVNDTRLDGVWDFNLRWTPRSRLAAAGGDGITIFDAIDSQLGLKLEPKQAPAPVIVVDRVNRKPTPNSPEVAASLPAPPPPQFEVATIKPTDPQFQGVSIQTPPNGLVNMRGVTLGFLIQTIWFLTPDMIVGAPKWVDMQRWDISAKISAAPGNAPATDMDSMIAMVRTLLEDRFALKTHMEERVVPAYTLTAVKPRLQKAEAANRTRCKEGPGADGKDPRITNPALSRLVSCTNMNMAEFAGQLPIIANALNPLNGPIRATVLDATGLSGAWDFTLNFSPELGLAPNAPTPSGEATLDPNGKLSLSEAITKQLGLKLELVKRPAQVLVIDHIEPVPAEN